MVPVNVPFPTVKVFPASADNKAVELVDVKDPTVAEPEIFKVVLAVVILSAEDMSAVALLESVAEPPLISTVWVPPDVVVAKVPLATRDDALS